MCLLTVYLYFFHDRELCVVLLFHIFDDFRALAWLLTGKLVARESYNCEALASRTFIQLDERSIIDLCEGSLGCYVCYQHTLVVGKELVEVCRFPFPVETRYVVELCGLLLGFV